MSWNIVKQGLSAALLMGAMALQPAFAAPYLSTSAPSGSVAAGDTVGVDVYITNATDLFGYEFTLLFDAALLQSTGATEGGFLAQGGATLFYTDDSIAGSIYTLGALFETMGVSGSGLLAHFDFTALAAGAPIFTLSSPLAVGSDLDPIAITVPEPATALLLALALGGMLVARRRIR
jgi:hypothetical protein